MTGKRFKLYEHKDNDYILDNQNTSLDFIEMLGDDLTSEEIVELLNEQHERIQQLQDENYGLKQTVAQLVKESKETSQKKEKYNIQPYAIMKKKRGCGMKLYGKLIDSMSKLYKENLNLKQALWEAEVDYYGERCDNIIDYEMWIETLKEDWDKEYWNNG